MPRLQRTDDEVDHLIQGRTWQVRTFRNQLRMKKTNHRGACASSRKTRVRDFKLSRNDPIRADDELALSVLDRRGLPGQDLVHVLELALEFLDPDRRGRIGAE